MSVKYKCDACGRDCEPHEYYPRTLFTFSTESFATSEQRSLMEQRKLAEMKGEHIVIFDNDPRLKPDKEWRWWEAGLCSDCVKDFHDMYIKYMQSMLYAFKKKIEKRANQK